MPQITMIFKTPEESEEFMDAYNGTAAFAALSDIDNLIRNKLKYSELTDEQAKAWEEIRSGVNEILADLKR